MLPLAATAKAVSGGADVDIVLVLFASTAVDVLVVNVGVYLCT